MRFVSLVPLALALAASACGYDERSYDGVSFACDLFHPCPDGAPCLAGRCPISGGGGGSNVGRQGVQCGGSFCSLGSSCCDDVISPLYCAGFDGCVGKELRCDGQEDCGNGTSCCLEGSLSICRPSCDSLEICASDADCDGPGDSFCCPFPFGPSLNLRICQPVSC